MIQSIINPITQFSGLGRYHIVHKFIRKMQPRGNELAKFLQSRLGTRNSAGFGGDYIQVDDRTVQGCPHKDCTCQLVILGKAPHFPGMEFHVSVSHVNEDFARFFSYLKSTYKLNQHNIVERVTGHYTIEDLRTRMTSHTNVKLISQPFYKYRVQTSVPSMDLSPEVERIVHNADKMLFSLRFPHIHFTSQMWAQVWSYEKTKEVPSLVVLAMRARSLVRDLIRRPGSRPVALSAMDNLHNGKVVNTLLKLQQTPPGVSDNDKYLFGLLPRALDIMYNKLRTRHLLGTQQIGLGFEELDGMYLGAAAGLSNSREEDIQLPGVSLRITASGKKYEVHQYDVESIIDFLDDVEKEPPIFWTLSFKSEHYFHYRPERYTDEEWALKMDKLRMYMIPTSRLILFERLVSKFRMAIERGANIRIGQAWVAGGADYLAKILGITRATAFLRQLCEGDFRTLDLSVASKWIEAYLSLTLAYDDKTCPTYAARKRITMFLIKNICKKIMHLYGYQWVEVDGVVPSGCLNTSHMDSIIVFIWWILFCIHTIENLYITAPDVAEKVEQAVMEKIDPIIYGDDHAWNRTVDPDVAPYITESKFAEFCQKYLQVIIRDIVDDAPFCSTVRDGVIVVKGLTFLRHQFVLNPKAEAFCEDGKQPTFLPFRETWEYVVRCVYGREPKRRTALDLILSSIGHAYGTYASNRDAYLALYAIYRCSLKELNMRPGQLPIDVLEIYSEDDFRDLRRKGISVKELMNGFPSWTRLEQKNTYDSMVHINQLDGHQYFDPEDLPIS